MSKFKKGLAYTMGGFSFAIPLFVFWINGIQIMSMWILILITIVMQIMWITATMMLTDKEMK